MPPKLIKKYLRLSFFLLVPMALTSCSQKEEASTFQPTPLVQLLVPTLASAIVSAEVAVQTALDKPNYAENTIATLLELNAQLGQLKRITDLVAVNDVNQSFAKKLANSAGNIHQLRMLIVADIITLKGENAAAAIRLGMVNELAEFCELTAEDIGQSLIPADF